MQDFIIKQGSHGNTGTLNYLNTKVLYLQRDQIKN
jgi:hypothetical protein